MATCTCGLTAFSASLCSIFARRSSRVRPAALTSPANGTLMAPFLPTVTGSKVVEPKPEEADEESDDRPNRPEASSITAICSVSPTATRRSAGGALLANRPTKLSGCVVARALMTLWSRSKTKMPLAALPATFSISPAVGAEAGKTAHPANPAPATTTAKPQAQAFSRPEKDEVPPRSRAQCNTVPIKRPP